VSSTNHSNETEPRRFVPVPLDLHRKARHSAWPGSGAQSEFPILAMQPKHWAESVSPRMVEPTMANA